jgi:hypothetical protein
VLTPAALGVMSRTMSLPSSSFCGFCRTSVLLWREVVLKCLLANVLYTEGNALRLRVGTREAFAGARKSRKGACVEHEAVRVAATRRKDTAVQLAAPDAQRSAVIVAVLSLTFTNLALLQSKPRGCGHFINFRL